jgi:competence protein ComEC
MNFKIGEFEITVLATFGTMELENNRSIITMAEIDGKKFLLAGDIESGAEKYLLKENLNLTCDVLKVAHHGSSTSSKMDFLKAVSPEMAVISVGKDNFYGHPHSEVLSALEHIGADIYRTDIDGDVSFFIEDGEIVPKTEK